MTASRSPRSRVARDANGNDLIDLDGVPVPVNPDGTITLYHRTTPAAKAEIERTGSWLSRENTGGVYFSTDPATDSYAAGYGDVLVSARVPARLVHLNDAFHNGEVHVEVSRRALTGAMLTGRRRARRSRRP